MDEVEFLLVVLSALWTVVNCFVSPIERPNQASYLFENKINIWGISTMYLPNWAAWQETTLPCYGIQIATGTVWTQIRVRIGAKCWTNT